MTPWDDRFLALAHHVASWSKDRSTKVGAVVVGPDREVRSLGYNGFPRGVSDDIEARHERPAKYAWTEHAERNAVYNASRFGASLQGCAIYITHPPCADCARAIIQAGIICVVFDSRDGAMVARWQRECSVGLDMLLEAGVVVRSQSGVVMQTRSTPCAKA
jgi:dCMP deaminase